MPLLPPAPEKTRKSSSGGRRSCETWSETSLLSSHSSHPSRWPHQPPCPPGTGLEHSTLPLLRPQPCPQIFEWLAWSRLPGVHPKVILQRLPLASPVTPPCPGPLTWPLASSRASIAAWEGSTDFTRGPAWCLLPCLEDQLHGLLSWSLWYPQSPVQGQARCAKAPHTYLNRNEMKDAPKMTDAHPPWWADFVRSTVGSALEW